jgi:hypothetical protein
MLLQTRSSSAPARPQQRGSGASRRPAPFKNAQRGRGHSARIDLATQTHARAAAEQVWAVRLRTSIHAIITARRSGREGRAASARAPPPSRAARTDVGASPPRARLRASARPHPQPAEPADAPESGLLSDQAAAAVAAAAAAAVANGAGGGGAKAGGGGLGSVDVLKAAQPVDRLRYQGLLLFEHFDADKDGARAHAAARFRAGGEALWPGSRARGWGAAAPGAAPPWRCVCSDTRRAIRRAARLFEAQLGGARACHGPRH